MYLMGACFFMRKEIFTNIGMFDEAVFLYGEENDIHYRLMHSNIETKKIVYDKSLKYLHLIGDRPIELKTKKQIFRASLHFCKKNNLNEIQQVKRTIRYERLLLFVEYLRKNKERIKVHKAWLAFLQRYHQIRLYYI